MANNSVFINIATVLWAVNVAALKDEAGKPIVPDTLGTINTGLVVLVFLYYLVLRRSMTSFSCF